MKKIFYLALMAIATLGFTACSDDYEDATSVHQYGENENPPLKGSDADMVSASVRMNQANAGTETVTVDLTDYADKIQTQLGMSLDQAIAGLNDGSVRFLPINPTRRTWDKTPANAGENTWKMSASGIVTDDDDQAYCTVQFVPSAKQLKITLTQNAEAGIIPVTTGFVKTEDSAYPTNFRCQTLVTVTDASVVDVAITVPKGGYATAAFNFADVADNIKFAFGLSDLSTFATDIDTSNPKYDIYMMSSTGTLYGGPGEYTANGAGYWLNQNLDIVTWGKDGYALFIEPDVYDYDAEAYRTDGGGLNIGRLDNDNPASGTVINASLVIKPVDTSNTKTLTLNFAITFE